MLVRELPNSFLHALLACEEEPIPSIAVRVNLLQWCGLSRSRHHGLYLLHGVLPREVPKCSRHGMERYGRTCCHLYGDILRLYQQELVLDHLILGQYKSHFPSHCYLALA